MESFQPGELDAKGLGYKDLAAINPGIVMASITGFGQTGPKKNLACNDLVALAESGILYVCGDPSMAPCKAPESQAYYFASLFATAGRAGGALPARKDRARRSHRHVDAGNPGDARAYHSAVGERETDSQARRQPAWLGGAGENLPGRDGFVYLYVTRQHWKLFLSIWKDHPAMFDAPDWLNNVYRRDHADELNPAVEAFLGKFTMAEITELSAGRRAFLACR